MTGQFRLGLFVLLALMASGQAFGAVFGVEGDGLPDFGYNPDTGQFWVETDESTFIALYLPGPQAISIDRWAMGAVEDGTEWSQAYHTGAEQWAASPGFLPEPSGPPDEGLYQVATYETGLTPADFGEIESGLEIDPFGPGLTVYSQMQFFTGDPSGSAAIPEPATFLIWGLLMSLGVVVGLRRRRKA